VRRLVLIALVALWVPVLAGAQTPPPALTGPINDFANVIDAQNRAVMERAIRVLMDATGDVVIVATVTTVEPYADAKELAVAMFENRGKGIGEKRKENGLLVLLALKERQVRVEVGYGLESIVTDGYAGTVSRQLMAPAFKRGDYGGGLRAGVMEIIAHVAEARGVTLDGTGSQRRSRPVSRGSSHPILLILVFLGFMALKLLGGLFSSPLSRTRRGGWSGWGGGGFGGFGGGGLGGGGGFGGFGGGGSGGGGGGSSW